MTRKIPKNFLPTFPTGVQQDKKLAPPLADVFSMTGHSHVMYHLKFKNGEEEEGEESEDPESITDTNGVQTKKTKVKKVLIVFRFVNS